MGLLKEGEIVKVNRRIMDYNGNDNVRGILHVGDLCQVIDVNKKLDIYGHYKIAVKYNDRYFHKSPYEYIFFRAHCFDYATPVEIAKWRMENRK